MALNYMNVHEYASKSKQTFKNKLFAYCVYILISTIFNLAMYNAIRVLQGEN